MFVSYSNKPSKEILSFLTTAGDNPVCKFLGEDNLCTIHDTKPLVCRHFPYNIPKAHLRFCPGIGKGKKTRKNRIKKMITHEQAAFTLTVENYLVIEDMLLDFLFGE